MPFLYCVISVCLIYLFVQNPKCLKTLKNGLKSNFGKNVNQT